MHERLSGALSEMEPEYPPGPSDQLDGAEVACDARQHLTELHDNKGGVKRRRTLNLAAKRLRLSVRSNSPVDYCVEVNASHISDGRRPGVVLRRYIVKHCDDIIQMSKNHGEMCKKQVAYYLFLLEGSEG